MSGSLQKVVQQSYTYRKELTTWRRQPSFQTSTSTTPIGKLRIFAELGIF